MGDTRFASIYEAVRDTPNRIRYLRSLSDEEVVAALAGASADADPLVANVLATEAMNRIARGRRALDSLPDGVVVVDREGCVTQLNRAAESLLGWMREEVIGRSSRAVLGLDATDPLWGTLATPTTSDETVVAHARIRAGSGRRFPARVEIAPLRGPTDVAGAVVVLRAEDA